MEEEYSEEVSTPARVAAAVSLGVAALLFLLIVISGFAGSDSSSAPSSASQGSVFYKVKPGDTLSGISEKTDIPLENLESLNPKIDPQVLSAGQKIRLRRN